MWWVVAVDVVEVAVDLMPAVLLVVLVFVVTSKSNLPGPGGAAPEKDADHHQLQ